MSAIGVNFSYYMSNVHSLGGVHSLDISPYAGIYTQERRISAKLAKSKSIWLPSQISVELSEGRSTYPEVGSSPPVPDNVPSSHGRSIDRSAKVAWTLVVRVRAMNRGQLERTSAARIEQTVARA